jgi:hypothetical protein
VCGWRTPRKDAVLCLGHRIAMPIWRIKYRQASSCRVRARAPAVTSPGNNWWATSDSIASAEPSNQSRNTRTTNSASAGRPESRGSGRCHGRTTAIRSSIAIDRYGVTRRGRGGAPPLLKRRTKCIPFRGTINSTSILVHSLSDNGRQSTCVTV